MSVLDAFRRGLRRGLEADDARASADRDYLEVDLEGDDDDRDQEERAR